MINPYKHLSIYGETIINAYMGQRRNEMPPHLFAVSDEAYRNMINGITYLGLGLDLRLKIRLRLLAPPASSLEFVGGMARLVTALVQQKSWRRQQTSF